MKSSRRGFLKALGLAPVALVAGKAAAEAAAEPEVPAWACDDGAEPCIDCEPFVPFEPDTRPAPAAMHAEIEVWATGGSKAPTAQALPERVAEDATERRLRYRDAERQQRSAISNRQGILKRRYGEHIEVLPSTATFGPSRKR